MRTSANLDGWARGRTAASLVRDGRPRDSEGDPSYQRSTLLAELLEATEGLFLYLDVKAYLRRPAGRLGGARRNPPTGTICMEMTGAAQGGARDRFIVTEAERQVADLLPIEVDPGLARATVERVPFWFHTFALNRADGIYTPGVARDHRYRISTLPNDFAGMSVLDVGTFDGFYAFLAEHRGADRVVAADNEQYRLWVASRWDVELEGGEGFRAIHRLLGSAVEYRRMDAFELDRLDERFDLVYCFGILHRVENPLGLLRVLRGRTASGGTVLVETYGVRPEDRDGPAIRVSEPGEVYARDEFVYWGFEHTGLERLARIAGFSRAESLIDVEVDGHPRIMGRLIA